ncbi:hypothetical protein ACSFBM_28395 [Variovorax sp. GB1R11]|uniref:hypothetical protein n=1 Tax=Variovorax sp. GB1R11 TaxID=3443741 RepID=UPI003F46D633
MTGVDGCVDRLGLPAGFPRPPVIQGVRPDASGWHASDGIEAFVEAKSERDVDNAHTRKQLRELSSLQSSSGKPCTLYLVIPRSAVYALDRVLIDLGLLRATNVRRIHVPAILLKH